MLKFLFFFTNDSLHLFFQLLFPCLLQLQQIFHGFGSFLSFDFLKPLFSFLFISDSFGLGCECFFLLDFVDLNIRKLSFSFEFGVDFSEESKLELFFQLMLQMSKFFGI